MPGARLPYGKQFSPNQVELPLVLELCELHEGDREALQSALRMAFFNDRPISLANRNTLAMNSFLAMRHYGLVAGGDDGAYTLGDLGKTLREIEPDANSTLLYEAMARHILEHLHGLQVLEVIDSLRARGLTVKVANVASELLAIGIDPGGGTSGQNINPLRLWLEEAGVLDGWEIDDSVLRHLIGAGVSEISEIAGLPLSHRAFLLALASMTGEQPYAAADVRRLAEVRAEGVQYDTKTFAKSVVGQLESDGWLAYSKATQGRGGKSHTIVTTQKFDDTLREPLLKVLVSQTHLQDPVSLRKPISELNKIVRDQSRTSHERGLALEGVCIQIVRLLGARFVGWRRRGDETSGAEVDVVAEFADGPYMLLQIQSKASPISQRDVIDREVGVASGLKSNVILLISAQKVSPAARRAAAAHMQDSPIAILFLDGTDLTKIETGSEVAQMLGREWNRVASIRSPRSRERAQSFRS